MLHFKFGVNAVAGSKPFARWHVQQGKTIIVANRNTYSVQKEIIMHYSKTLALALLLFSLAITPAFAQRHCWDGPLGCDGRQAGQLENLKQALDLTPQQEADFKEIRIASEEKTEVLREKIKANREAIHNALNAEILDEPRLRELTREQAELHADLMVAKHGMRAKINQILSPEQQKKHEELRQQRMGKKRTKRSCGSAD
jgi:Spy/CpxP family protein refolding chaperone